MRVSNMRTFTVPLINDIPGQILLTCGVEWTRRSNYRNDQSWYFVFIWDNLSELFICYYYLA